MRGQPMRICWKPMVGRLIRTLVSRALQSLLQLGTIMGYLTSFISCMRLVHNKSVNYNNYISVHTNGQLHSVH